MIMKMNIHYYILAAAVATGYAAGAQAQNAAKQDTTMNKVMVIENEYIPQISEAQKINMVPEVKAPEVKAKKVEYASTSSPSGNIPTGTMDPIIGRELQPDAAKGYVRVGYGNLGNLDLLGNYLFCISSRDKLNLNVQAEGMNGNLTLKEGVSEPEKWKSKYYRLRGGLDYVHQFDALDLNVAAGGGMTTLNYSPFVDLKNQRYTTGDILFGVKSTEEDADFSYKASTNYIYYQRKALIHDGNQTENRIRTMGEVSGKIAEGQTITVAAEMNNLIYKDKLSETSLDGYKLTDYTTVDFNPYYSMNNDSWMLRVGAHVDLSLGYGTGLQMSPDVNINYIFADNYIVYLNATGGRHLNDFRQAEIENPYSVINGNLVNGYEQVNAEIGVKGSPLSGFHFNIHGGYQKLNNDIYSDFDPTSDVAPTKLPTMFLYGKTNNAFVGLDLSYDYCRKVALLASALYRKWDISDKESTPENALLFHPELQLNAAVTVRPIDKLMIELSYQYEKRAEIESSGQRPNAVSDLRLHGEYNFYKGVSIYANVNNILNKSYQYYYYQPTEGFNFLGGLIFKF
jgi:hypothetical protein